MVSVTVLVRVSNQVRGLVNQVRGLVNIKVKVKTPKHQVSKCLDRFNLGFITVFTHDIFGRVLCETKNWLQNLTQIKIVFKVF